MLSSESPIIYEDSYPQYINKNIQAIRNNNERRASQILPFIRDPHHDEREVLESIVENRNRIRDNFKGKLQIIIKKTTKIEVIDDDYKFNNEAQLKRKLDLCRQLDIDIHQLESDEIYLNIQDFHAKYEVLNSLGEGCLGLVKRIQEKRTKEFYAVKMVQTTDEEIIRNMIIEFNNLMKFNHENIVKVFSLYIAYDDRFQSESCGYVVMELIEGDEMFEYITKKGHFNETQAKDLFRQLLSAIEYMHRHGVCHRDLKPHNILCIKESNTIKVTDFNVSKFSENYKDFGDLKENAKIEMWTYTGTVAFSAPEIFSGEGYTQMVDMWSAGCILYSMLSGQLPFNATYLNDLIDKIVLAQFEFPDEQFSIISDEAKNLIKQLLQKDPAKRLQPRQALQHEWFGIQEKFIRKTTKTLTYIKENISHLTNRSTDKNRRRTLLLKIQSKEIQSEGPSPNSLIDDSMGKIETSLDTAEKSPRTQQTPSLTIKQGPKMSKFGQLYIKQQQQDNDDEKQSPQQNFQNKCISK